MSIPHFTVVHAPACHFCADAREALADFAAHFPLRIELLEAASEAGKTLVDAHRPTMFPLVLLDGVFFSQGRLPRRKLRALLSSRQAVNS